MKTMYEFDAITREYTGTTAATPDPKRPGQYLPRQHATFTPPPACEADEVALFLNGHWVVKPDLRGRDIFFRNAAGNIESRRIRAIDEVLPDEAVFDVAKLPKTAAEKAEAVRAERNSLLAEADVLLAIAEDEGGDTTALRAYRRALRDLPQQAAFPDEIDWPEPWPGFMASRQKADAAGESEDGKPDEAQIAPALLSEVMAAVETETALPLASAAPAGPTPQPMESVDPAETAAATAADGSSLADAIALIERQMAGTAAAMAEMSQVLGALAKSTQNR